MKLCLDRPRSRFLFAALTALSAAACGAAPAKEPKLGTSTSGAIVKTAPPQNTVFEFGADEAVAAGPFPPGHEPPVSVSAYRIEGAGQDTFALVPLRSDGSRGASVPVPAAEVAKLLAIAEKHKAALHCVEGVNRAPYNARSIKVAGPLAVQVSSDCQGAYPSSDVAPREYRDFRAGYEALRDALVKVVEDRKAGRNP